MCSTTRVKKNKNKKKQDSAGSDRSTYNHNYHYLTRTDNQVLLISYNNQQFNTEFTSQR